MCIRDRVLHALAQHQGHGQQALFARKAQRGDLLYGKADERRAHDVRRMGVVGDDQRADCLLYTSTHS